MPTHYSELRAVVNDFADSAGEHARVFLAG